MRLTWFKQRVVDVYRAAQPQSCQAPPAACKGQSGLERRVLEVLIEYARDVEPLDDGVLGLRAASAGPVCLHVDAEPSLVGYLVHRLTPAVVHVGEQLVGVPGLRLMPGRPGRLELCRHDGHGQLVFHLDPAAECALREWDRDRATVYRGGRSAPGATVASPCCELRGMERLHPSEQEALRSGVDTVLDEVGSRELRRLVRHLPAVPDAHDRSVSLLIDRKAP
ncbi:hypothetical protein AB5L52_14735 [Streptomyces sp. CG4]|uniref:hypothetical protein n=1 Tax=Streptomyces sp. CG4 TaxID=408783 RepID=UPI0034E1A3D2